MIHYNSREGWMEFPYLTNCTGLQATYTLAYKLTDDTSEKWTSRFIRFKDKEAKAFYGAAYLFYETFPRLLASIGHKGADCTLLCALSSGETSADLGRQIPFITSELARDTGAHLAIGAVAKQVHNRIHNLYRAEQREAELDKANYVCEKLPAKNVFIFDDFVTRGGTLSRVAQAVHATNPGSRVYGIALAKTERISYCPNPKNDHVDPSYDKIWTDAEAQTA